MFVKGNGMLWNSKLISEKSLGGICGSIAWILKRLDKESREKLPNLET